MRINNKQLLESLRRLSTECQNIYSGKYFRRCISCSVHANFTRYLKTGL